MNGGTCPASRRASQTSIASTDRWRTFIGSPAGHVMSAAPLHTPARPASRGIRHGQRGHLEHSYTREEVVPADYDVACDDQHRRVGRRNRTHRSRVQPRAFRMAGVSSFYRCRNGDAADVTAGDPFARLRPVISVSGVYRRSRTRSTHRRRDGALHELRLDHALQHLQIKRGPAGGGKEEAG